MLNKSIVKGVVLAVLLAAVFAGLTWSNYQFASINPGGNDFYPRYLGTRLYLTRGLSPYSEETTQEIQYAMYGRLANENEDQQLFVYPLYIMPFFAPFAAIENFDLSRALWMSASFFAVAAIMILALRITEWRPKTLLLAAYALFCVTWYHTVRPIINGNPSVLAALFVVLMLFCLKNDHDRWAGVMLALATIKPQAVLPVVLLVLFWTAFQKRWKVWISFLLAMGVLAGISLVLQPDWIPQYIGQIFSYPGYTTPGTPVKILSLFLGDVPGRWAGRLINIIAIGCLVWSWMKAPKQSMPAFLWTFFFTLALTPFTGIYTASSNYIIMLPGIALLSAAWERQWRTRAVPAILIHYLVLTAGLWLIFYLTLIGSNYQNPFMVLVFPAYMVFMLLAERKWAVSAHSAV